MGKKWLYYVHICFIFSTLIKHINMLNTQTYPSKFDDSCTQLRNQYFNQKALIIRTYSWKAGVHGEGRKRDLLQEIFKEKNSLHKIKL